LTDWHHTVASVRLHWIIGINRANHPRPEFFALSSYLYHLLMRSRASAIGRLPPFTLSGFTPFERLLSVE